uniref:Uncharacterized protein n=1 Tax=Romanomermis culicivorax TaxID=13658 RepID=A0A915HL45_ROMCU
MISVTEMTLWRKCSSEGSDYSEDQLLSELYIEFLRNRTLEETKEQETENAVKKVGIKNKL